MLYIFSQSFNKQDNMSIATVLFKVFPFFRVFLFIAISQQRPFSNVKKLYLPQSTSGPESIAFDSHGGGPYTGVSDGRIVKYDSSLSKFLNFAFTTPNRTSCDGNRNDALGPKCGRPLGVEFFKLKNELFITDAYRGLFRVGQNGGLATLICNEAEGLPFKHTNGLSVDQVTGDVYFSDFSAVFNPRTAKLLTVTANSDFGVAIATNDSSGRLLKYDYETRQITVLERGLSGPNGLVLSADRSYILISERIAKRLKKFWLSGPRAFQSEILPTHLQGTPDNIRRSPSGDFWIPLNTRISVGAKQIIATIATKINGDGRILRTFPLKKLYDTTASEINELDFKFYIGSVTANFVGVFDRF